MDDERRLAAEPLKLTVASLISQRIAAVMYAALTGGADGHEPEAWDHGDWHEPTMGCQVTTDAGAQFTLIWNHTFGCYGLEVFEQPLTDFLVDVGEPWFPHAFAVDDHQRWAPLIGREIIDAEMSWIEFEAFEPRPLWIRLDFAPTEQDPPGRPGRDSVWIAAGCSRGQEFALGSDDVMVVFDQATADQVGLVLFGR